MSLIIEGAIAILSLYTVVLGFSCYILCRENMRQTV